MLRQGSSERIYGSVYTVHISVHMAKRDENSDTRKFDSRVELQDAFEEFKRVTKTGWRCTSTKTEYGKYLYSIAFFLVYHVEIVKLRRTKTSLHKKIIN